MTQPQRSAGARMMSLVQKFTRRPPKQAERWLLLAAVGLFAGGAAIAFRALPDDIGPFRWPPLIAAALIGVPLTTLLNAAEYRLAGRVLDKTVGVAESLKISVIGAATNLLPIPGSVIVRIAGLRQKGEPLGRATGATASIGIMWLGITAVIAGSLLIARLPLLGSVFTAGGVVAIVASTVMIRMLAAADRFWGVVRATVFVELLAAATAGFRLFLVLEALGAEASVGQAVTLTISGALASAVGLFPGGLGLREVISAALSPLIGLPATIGFVGTALDRLIGIVIHLPLTVIVLWNARRPTVTAPD